MKMPINNTCPICGHVLKPGETLTARYYRPKNWWVIEHHIAGKASSHCAQAGPGVGFWSFVLLVWAQTVLIAVGSVDTLTIEIKPATKRTK